MKDSDSWSFYSAHYDGLSAQEIKRLDQAIRLGYCGFDNEAVEILCALQSETDSHPAILVERASIYHRMGVETKTTDFLKQCSRPKNIHSPSAGADWWDLIAIIFAMSEMYAAGTVSNAVSEAVELYSRLVKNLPEDFTSIDVVCFGFCSSIFSVSSSVGNFSKAVTQNPDIDRVPRQKMAARIRKALLKRGDLHLAADFALDESPLYLGQEKLTAFEAIWKVQTERCAELKGSDLVYLANFAIHYAEQLILLDMTEKARSLVSVAEAYYFSAFGINTHDDIMKVAPRQWVLVCRVHAHLEERKDRLSDGLKQLHLAQTAESLNCYRIARLLFWNAADLMNEPLNSRDDFTDSEDLRVLRISIAENWLNFEEHKAGSALFLASAILHRCGLDMLESRPLLVKDTISHFWKRFPKFDASIATSLLSSTFQTASLVHDERELLETPVSHDLDKKSESLPQKARGNSDYCNSELLDFLGVNMPDCGISFDQIQEQIQSLTARHLLLFVRFHLENDQLSQKDAAVLLLWDCLRDTQQSLVHKQSELSIQALDALPISSLSIAIVHLASSTPTEDWESWFGHVKSILNRNFPILSDPIPHPHTVLQKLQKLKEVAALRNTNLTDEGETAYQAYLESERTLHLLETSTASRVGKYDILRSELTVASKLESLCYYRSLREKKLVTKDMLEDAFLSLTVSEVGFEDNLIALYQTYKAMAENLSAQLRWFDSDLLEDCLSYYEKADETYRYLRAESFDAETSRSLGSEVSYYWKISHLSCHAQAISLIVNYLYKERLMSEDSLSHKKSNFWHDFDIICYRQSRTMSRLRKMLESNRVSSAADGSSAGEDENSSAEDESSFADRETPLPDRQKMLQRALFTWTQGLKATNLTNLLGLDSRISAKFLQPLRKDSKAAEMLIDEQQYKIDMRNSSISANLQLRRRLQNHQQLMWSTCPELRPMLSVREGRALNMEDPEKFGHVFGSNVVFVDWFYLKYSEKASWNLGMALYRNGKLEQICPLSTRLEDVQDWIQENLDQDQYFKMDPDYVPQPPLISDSSTSELDSLSGLLRPLERYTIAGENLLLCPTHNLHRVPLHAIPIQGHLLIERNLITYAQSFSLFRLCHTSQQSFDQEEKIVNFRASIFNALEANTTASKALNELASTLNAKVYSGTECSKSNFKTEGETSCLVHVHGHVEFDNDTPLNHSIVLKEHSIDQNDLLTAGEICEIKLRSPSIVSIMGCNSGRSRISDFDNLIGLTAAFHFAGAGAVISTLWPVSSKDCLLFSKAFYLSFTTQMSSENDTFSTVSLAKAMQDGVKSVMFNEQGDLRAPYHWAGFFLHGSNEFPKIAFSNP